MFREESLFFFLMNTVWGVFQIHFRSWKPKMGEVMSQKGIVWQQVSWLYDACSAALCFPARLPRHLVKLRPELTRQHCLCVREIVSCACRALVSSVFCSVWNRECVCVFQSFINKDDELDLLLGGGYTSRNLCTIFISAHTHTHQHTHTVLAIIIIN